ncbi:hypothetical protein [Leptolyngbya sp. 7M]|uniref:hypothetical protein n=1 Tax=Leptolyngbya sp. 7M TaxID=2812896 RepID=UPI001B8B8D23|nr:hypothetical protein [Leptolyngbya sp. 7M]QYO66172.1 hypothetical protein JVX88_05055 [Leptolyngbya sp. 7M]
MRPFLAQPLSNFSGWHFKLIGFIFIWSGAFLHLPVLDLYAQSLPKNIRGYRVHRDVIKIERSSVSDADSPVTVSFKDLRVSEIGLTGSTFLLDAELRSEFQSGKVEILDFYDVRVNGIAVHPEEYVRPFEFKKGVTVELPEPVRIFLPVTGAIRGVLNEVFDSKVEWTVTGRMFVFGKFRRYGFSHKRVVVVDFEFAHPNPLRGSRLGS